MDKYREEFENFCKLNLFVRLDVDGDGNFISRETKYKFRLWCLVWKASRESMKQYYKQHLAYDDTYTSGYKTGFNDAIDATDKNLNRNLNLFG